MSASRGRGPSAGRAGLLALALTAAVAAGPALAHTGGTNGYAVISVDGPHVRYQLTLWPAALPPAVGEQIALARAGDAAARARLIGMVREKVGFVETGRRCPAGPGAMETPAGRADSVTVTVDYACPADGRDLLARDDLFDVLGADYHTVARIERRDSAVQFVFTPERRERRVGPAADAVWSFVWLGMEHVLTGWDHLLFLLVLMLRGGGWVSLAKIVTAFTVAHSITLALAALGVLTLPDRLVETTIALSIAVVAAENLLRPAVSRRWLVSFAFGLVHGFGFSSALREIGLPTGGLLVSLLGFNVGVELGQGLVVALALPLLALLGQTRWESRLVRAASLAIFLVGAVLAVERTFL